jgi:hypothetical protein
VRVVRKADPEILLGWNNTTAGWGYILRRGELLGIDVPRGLSRAPMWGNNPRCQIPGNQAEVTLPFHEDALLHSLWFFVSRALCCCCVVVLLCCCSLISCFDLHECTQQF